MAIQMTRLFTQDINKPVEIRQGGDIVFNDDNLSNIVGVALYDGTSEATPVGTVVGAVVCSDGSTVPVTNGTISGNTVSITLTEACFAIPGRIGVGIQLVSGDTQTTVLKAVYNVEVFTTSNVIDPSSRISLAVGDLIDDIATATASIPASYTDLMAAVAPTFSSSVAYTAGKYVWYGGDLYRFTADHAAGAWTGSDASAAVVADDMSDLKSAFGNHDDELNGLLGLMNYGYDTPADLEAGTGASTIVAIKRIGTSVLMNGNPTAAAFMVKLNNDVQRASTTAQIKALTNGTVLTNGHTYRVTETYVSGTGTYNSAAYLPTVSVLKSGESSSVGNVITDTPTVQCREFTADDSTYMIGLYCEKNSSMSNLLVSVTMQDMADQSIYEMIDALTVAEGSAWE